MTERDQLLALGREELARGGYLAAHERWEDAWRLSVPPDKDAVQALAQLAGALFHLANGNRVGATRVLDKAARKLAPAATPRTIGVIEVASVRGLVERLRGELAAGATPDLRAIAL
jgi:uncharacterized protein